MKKNRQGKGFILGFIVAALIFNMVIPAVAATVKQARITYKDIKIQLDGKTITPKDTAGRVVDPFIMGGTTYLPIRAVGEALGLYVGWDNNTNTVILKSKIPDPTPAPTPTPTPGGSVSYAISNQKCEVKTNILGDTAYTAFVEVENTGSSNLYLKDATFDFEDPSGKLLATEKMVNSGPNVIAPGEKGYFFDSGILEGDITPNTNYIFKPHIKVLEAKVDLVRYSISNTSMTERDYGRVGVVGRITNNTQEKGNLISILVVLYGKGGTPVYVDSTSVIRLDPGETASFDTYGIPIEDFGLSPSDIESYDIIACPYQYQYD